MTATVRGDGGAEVALLDQRGVIVHVNRAWREFCVANGGDPGRAGVGESYLDACAGARDRTSGRVADAVLAAIRGDRPVPDSIAVPCPSPTELRLFDVRVASRLDDRARCLGATVTLTLAHSVPRVDPATAVAADVGAEGPDAGLRADAVYQLARAIEEAEQLEDALRRSRIHDRKLQYGLRKRLAVTPLLEGLGARSVRGDLTDALERYDQQRHRARVSMIAVQLAEGESTVSIARSWGVSRQLATRYAREARGRR